MGNSLIKLTQRNRNNDNGADNNRSRIQSIGGNSNGMLDTSSVDGSQHLLSSPIFKLNGHCFDEIFEYLAMGDLHSLSQTCKSMQRMTGEFFTRNYSAAKFNCLCDGIYLIDSDDKHTVAIDKCIPVPGFMHLITWISIGHNVHSKTKQKWTRKQTFPQCNITDYCHRDMGKFKYIKLHAGKLKSIKKLTLTSVSINKQTVGYIREVLPNIEVLELMGGTVYQDFHDVFLKYCTNLQRIHFIRVYLGNKYKWLQRQYGKLQHLEWDDQDKSERIVELSTFFELNPNLRSFSCSASTLLSNEDTFFNCKVKLDTFELKCARMENVFLNKPLWDLLDRLHAHGFYKRLHASSVFNEYCNELPAMPFLEQLSLVISRNSLGPISNHLIEYVGTGGDFAVSWDSRMWIETMKCYKSQNEVFAEDLKNVERLYLFREGFDIQLFIKKLRNLKKLKLFRFKSAEILQLDVLNRAREKLGGAQKVTIYVPDDVFLATKWATKNGTTNFSLIEMKRTHSIEWNRYHFYFLLPMIRLPPGMK